MALTKISRSLLDTGVSDSSDATAITIDSSENVGIACTPHFPFDVQLNSSRRIGFNYSDSQNSILSHDGSGNIETLGLRGNTILFYSDYDASNPDGVERMRIDSSGNVGIGTTSPSFDLDIQDTSNTYLNVQATATSGEASLALKGKNSSGTDRTLLFKYDNSDLFRIATPSAVDIRFETSDAERMRIDASGGVMFNTTSALGQTTSFAGTNTNNWCGKTTTDTYSNFLGFASGGNITYYVTGQGNYFYNGSAVSDRDLKENIESITESSLAKVKLLEPKTFNFKADDNFGTNKKTGFIAQEVAAIFGTTDGVATGTDGQKDMGIDPTGLIAHLTKAIQEQQEQIEALQSEINTLKGG